MKAISNFICASLAIWVGAQLAGVLAAEPPVSTVSVRIINIVGKVEVQRGQADWQPATVMQTLQVGDRLRTQERSRTDLRWGTLDVVRVPASTILTLEEPESASGNPGIHLTQGMIYFYGRDQPGSTSFRTPVVSGAIRGTEFVLQVEESGATRLSLMDGAVDLKNEQGRVQLASREQAEVVPHQAPVKTPMLNATARIQWFLYYPGVLVPEDLPLTGSERAVLESSMVAYRAGDLRSAAGALPVNPAGDDARVYAAAVLLSSGSSQEAAALLETVRADHPLANTLRRFMAVVQGDATLPKTELANATGWLVESYVLAAQAQLPAALRAAREAARLAPDSGFAWARVAELEFSMGRIGAAKIAVNRALASSPKNAEAEALHGFLAAADDDLRGAHSHFQRAIELDASLGNAWLGRGLVHFRENWTEAGREDLQLAAALEPRRSLLRSLLGKAFSENSRPDLAVKELQFARELDPADPTPWLYAALLEQRENRINDSARDLRTSQALNDNRGVFRSRLMLDQDAAVRSANLASVYQDAGLSEFGERQAAQAVQSDYGNASAHLFLANSYQLQQRDQGVNLRLETPATTEYLLASLLAPVGQNQLSRLVSQQEYSRLFARDGFGVASSTEYRGTGFWEESSSYYGTHGHVSFAADVSYVRDPGERPNQDLSQLGFATQLKWQLGPQDEALAYVSWSESQSGDRAQYYQPALADRGIRVAERQKPNFLVGYHRQWAPGQDTLFLFGRFDDDYRAKDPAQTVPLYVATPAGFVPLPTGAPFTPLVADFSYRDTFTLYSAELQHITKVQDHEFIGGIRYQTGGFETDSTLANAAPPGLLALFFPGGFNSTERLDEEFHRLGVYLYDTWEISHGLWLVAGVNGSQVRYPANFRNAPLHAGHLVESAVSPKAGIVWQPGTNILLRAQYSRSLGGASFDQSISLEPTLVAGLNQSFRSLIPESVIGSASAPRNEVISAGFEQVWPSDTYFLCQGDWWRSRVAQDFGGYAVSFGAPPNSLVTLSQQSRYDERTVKLTLGQMVGSYLGVGVTYRLSDATLDNAIPALSPVAAGYTSHQEAVLHRLGLYAVANHPSGAFARVESWWYHQHNAGYSPGLPGDDFWQTNLRVGMRFWQRRAEASIALLNVTDQDYRLNPLNVYQDLPRSRTVAASLRFVF